MKKLFLILILIKTISSFAQPYQPCLEGEIIRWSFLDQGDCDGTVKTTEIIAFGDTILNGIMYKKLYIDNNLPYNSHLDIEENNANWRNYEPQLYYQWENFYIRESEDASKLYIYNSSNDEEYLISDINLQEGDVFNIYSFSECESIVDSVYFENGLKHVRWHNLYNSLICQIENKYTFIESVGSDMWFIYPMGCSMCFGLNCFQNQTSFYKNNKIILSWDFSNCPCGYINDWVGINSVSEDNYHVFIEKGQIEIYSESNINADISIYDMQGRLCYSKNNIFNKNVIISTASLHKGIYVLNISNKENNKTSNKKIIIFY